jgi:xanthine/uracil/vitamin C permease (AzgA family)
MADDLARQIASLQRDTAHRQAITVATVIGIFASVACGLFAPLRWPHAVPSAHSPGMMVCLIVPFAVCFGAGHAIYRVLRWLRG